MASKTTQTRKQPSKQAPKTSQQRDVELSRKKLIKAFEEAYGMHPTEVKGVLNARTEYYAVQLEKLSFGMLDIEYNKEMYRWDKDYMKEGILLKGLLSFTNDNLGNLLPLKCGATGINVFNRPTEIIVANPVVGSFTRQIGVDCEIVYLQSKQGGRYRTIKPIITLFAQKLANCDASIDINLFNSRTTMVFRAPTPQAAESYKAMYDEMSEGKPAVFIDEEMGSLLQNGGKDSNLYMIKAKENFIADVVQNEKLQIVNEFLTTIGINTSNTTKRERLVTDEVNSNNVEVEANVKLWKENVEECVERVNKMFPDANLRITFPYYDKMQKLDEQGQTSDQDKRGGEEDEPNR